jgi:Txe/YoeB family toxin of Txe-Axe toxin-antitoxin module
MPRITLKETITKEIEIPMETLCELIDHLSEGERAKLLERAKKKPIKLSPFKKDKIDSILADFEATNLYEDNFLRDLKEGLKKSSLYRWDVVPVIVDLREDLKKYIQNHGLSKKWEKAKRLFQTDPSHPSLSTELLEPKHRLIYSFRIDIRYRALFICLPDSRIEIVAITRHYRK